MFDIDDKTPEDMTAEECLYAAREQMFDYRAQEYIPNDGALHLQKIAFCKLYNDTGRSPANELTYARCLINGTGCERDVFLGLDVLINCSKNTTFSLKVRALAHEELYRRYLCGNCFPMNYSEAYFHLLCTQYLFSLNSCARNLIQERKSLEKLLTSTIMLQQQDKVCRYLNLQ
jgi:hypothetical protein